MENSKKASSKEMIFRLTLDAMFAAIYVVISTLLTIPLPSIEISWSSLPILLAAFLLSWSDAVAVALVGSFFEQLFSVYGLMATAPAWMAPPILQALLAGLLVYLLLKKDNKTWKIVVIIVISEVWLTSLNIVVSFLDSYVFTDYVWYGVAQIPGNFLNCAGRTVLSAVAIPVILIPLRRVLGKIRGN